MQKGLIFVIIFFIYGLFIANGASVTDKYMITGENLTLNGKLIVFLFPIQNGNAIFSVDGVWVKVPINKTISGNGAKFLMKEADSNYAIVTITVDFACGNNVCESVESGEGSCCKDCGCLAGYSCVDNRCVVSAYNNCIKDADCDDKNPCTKDLCSGAPRVCKNDAISVCANNDGCCLNLCKVYTDSDCKSSCGVDAQCDDNDSCTTDKCGGGNCSNLAYGGCNINGTCVGNGTRTENSYCFSSALFVQKKSGESCKYDFECVSYDCASARCKGDEPKKEPTKKPENPISKFFYENSNIYLYIILGFAVIVILIEIRKYIKDKKEGI